MEIFFLNLVESTETRTDRKVSLWEKSIKPLVYWKVTGELVISAATWKGYLTLAFLIATNSTVHE